MRFKDNSRQLAYEVLQGVKITEEDQASTTKTQQTPKQDVTNDETAEREREENVRQLVADCRRQLVDLNEDCYGSWALINYIE